MQDKKKTKDQKTLEVAKLRQRIAELEASEAERKRAVEALQRSYDELKEREKLYRTLVENIDIGLGLIDPEHTIVLASAAEGTPFSNPINDFIGKKCFREYEKRDTVCPHCPGVQAMATGQPAEVETEWIKDDGSCYDVRVQAFPIFGDDGTATGFIHIVENITDRKKAERNLRNSEERFRMIFETAQDLIFLKDRDLKFTAINPAMERYFGVSASEVVGKTSTTVLGKKVGARSKEEDLHVLNGEIIDAEHSFTARGNPVVHNVIKVPMRNSVDEIIGLCGIARDITDRKQAHKVLRESEMRYRATLNAMGDAIHVIDSDLRFILFNDTFRQWNEALGLEIDVMGRSVFEIFPFLPDNVRDEYRRVFDTGEMLITEDHTTVNGREFITETRKIPIYESRKGVRVVTVIRDITERKQAEEALRRSEQELSIRNQIAKIFLTVPDDEMYGKVLEIVLEAMQSRYGVFGYLDEDGAMVVPSMTRHIWDQCQVPDKDIVFPRTTWGDSTWPRAIKEKRIIYSNNPSVNVPEGHIDITRHISMPILYQGEAIGLFQVANKEVDYDEKDIQLLETLAEHIAPILYARLQRDFQERERKLAEDALRESAEQYRIMTNTSMDGFAKLDLDGRFLDVNEAYCHLLGYSKEELLKMTVADIEAQATPDELKRQAKELMEVGVGRFETRHRRKDGHIIDVEISMTLLRQSGHILVFLRDITKRKQAEEELRESAEKFRIISNTAMDGFSEVDQDGHFVDVNEESCRISGYSRDEHLTMSIADMEAVETPDKIKRKLQNIIETGSDRFESRIRHKDGRFIDIEASISFFPQTGHFLNFHRDITDRKHAEEKLRESEEHYRRLIEISPEAIIVQHKNNIVLANTAGARLVGAATFEKLIGKPIAYFVHPHYRKAIDNRIRRVIKKQKAVPFMEQKFLRLDGRIINVEVAVTPFSYQSDSAVQIVARDITERKEAEKDRKESFQRLRRSLEETIGALSSTLEARDPYTGGHQKRVAYLASAIAEEMGLSVEQIDGIRMAGLVHDIGKIYVPSDLLNKTSRLSGPEFELFKSHCNVGYEILKTIDFPWPIASMVLQHHERQDGSGYPQGLYGGDIILEARILAVADVIEAMSGHRPYRPAYSVGDALEEVLRQKDSLYDPEVVDACLRVFYDKGFTFEEAEKTELKTVPHIDQD